MLTAVGCPELISTGAALYSYVCDNLRWVLLLGYALYIGMSTQAQNPLRYIPQKTGVPLALPLKA